MSKIADFVTAKAIEIAMRKPSPSTIPLSGDDRLALRDYRTIYLGDATEKWRFLVQAIDDAAAHGLWFSNEGNEGEPRSIPRSEWSAFAVHVTDYFKEFEARYPSARRYLFAYYVDETEWSLIWYRLQNYMFSKRTLVRKARIDVLRYVLSETIQNRNFQTNAVDLTTAYNTIRWVIHPQHEEISQYNLLILNSLVASGDLNKDRNSYRLEPQALSTISQYEEENRRHADSVSQQKYILILTAVIALAAVAQAVAAYLNHHLSS